MAATLPHTYTLFYVTPAATLLRPALRRQAVVTPAAAIDYILLITLHYASAR